MFYFLILLLAIEGGYASTLHRFHNGECPQIEPMPNFNIDKFLGEWYIIENANDNGHVCLREEFIESQEPIPITSKNDEHMIDMSRNELEPKAKLSKFEVEDDSLKILEKIYQIKRSYLPFGERQIITETGKISFLSNKTQSDMEINLPYAETGMLNIKHYEVIATDYDNFAMIWRCQKTIFGHRRTAQLMTRNIKIDEKLQQELQTLIKHFEVQFDIKFTPVRQTDCDVSEVVENQQESINKKNKRPVIDPSSPEVIPTQETNNNDQPKSKNKKRLINIEIGGFQLTISYPFF